MQQMQCTLALSGLHNPLHPRACYKPLTRPRMRVRGADLLFGSPGRQIPCP